MEGATLTQPRTRALPAVGPAKLAFAGLCVAALALFLIYPTYPNYDSYYSMLWGREALSLHHLSFVGYRHPTEHPLAILLSIPLDLLGGGSDRVLVGLTIVAFLALVAGLYRLGRESFGPLTGAVTVILLCTRFDFPFLAVRGYIDIPYLALIVWAATLEVVRPKRGLPVLGLLTAASLLRPEAWPLIALYWLWIVREATWRQRLLYTAMAAAGPLAWAILDAAVTGDPLFSLHSTSGLAEELGRAKGVSAIPDSTRSFLTKLDKLPVLLAAVPGALAALWFAPRRLVMPTVLFGSGLATFAMVGLAGLSVIERYLLVPSLVVMLMAGVTVAGWEMLEPGNALRRPWMVFSVVALVAALGFTATRVSFGKLNVELTFRGQAHTALEQVLGAPAVQAGLRCGPVSVPTHKLVPDVRWILHRGANGVLARAEGISVPPTKRSLQVVAQTRTGVAIVVHGRAALPRQVFVDSTVDPIVNVPPPGFIRAAVSRYYAAYVRC